MDLGREIAQRLGCPPETVAPLLKEIVRDIRHKTTRGETARLHHIGAFEPSDAGLVFEADPGLVEIVNAPFAGLPAIPLADPAPVRTTGAAVRGERPRSRQGGAPSARRKTRRTRAPGQAGSVLNAWIVGIGLPIIAVAAWLLLTERTENPAIPPERSAAQETAALPVPETTPPETALLPAEAAEHTGETALPPGETRPTDAAHVVVAAPDTLAAAPDTLAAAPDPLRGREPIDRTQGGYTIVVASEANEERAQGWAEGWRAQGFRTIVLSHTQNGGALYRVGVGQFDLLEEAARVRDALTGNALPRDAWVLRIPGIR